MATQPYGIGINLDNAGLVRFVNGTLETHPQRRHMERLVPQVVDGSRSSARSAYAEVCGLMAEAEDEFDRDSGTADSEQDSEQKKPRAVP